MNVGDAEYKAALRRYTELVDQPVRTWTHLAEMLRIGRQLIDAEMRFEAETHAPTMRDLVDDWDVAMRNANSLGTVEL